MGEDGAMRWRLLVLGALLVVLAATVPLALRSDEDRALDRTDAPTTTTSAPSTTTTLPPPPTTSPAQAVAAGECPAVPARRGLDPNRPRYTVRVDADPAASRVRGDLTVRFTPDLAVDLLVFRLWPNGPRPSSVGAKLTVGEVISEGTALVTRQPDATTLEVVLPEPARAGRTIEVSMPWTLEVPGSVRDRVSHSGDSLRLGSFLPLLAWEPGLGWAREPATSGFAEATMTPAADWSVSIVVPAGYDVLASGQQGDDGRWQGTGLRDFAMSIGHFALASASTAAPDPIAVTVGVQDGVGESPQRYLDEVVAALQSFGRMYGPYPWPTYTLAITPGLEGGIEFPTHVMQGPGSIGRTTPHEVAHMWFYGLVGNNQGRDPWLDEGIASYAEARVLGTLGDFRSRSIPSAGRGRAGEPMSYWESRQSSYYRSVYVQGAVAVADLGPVDLVDCALRHYVARNAFRVAQPADLLAAVQVVFPDAAARLAPYGLP
jgi:hypothetical protein